MMESELKICDWHKWSLHQKRAYVKGSSGGFNLNRADIAALDDDYREMRYSMKTIRMAVDVIDQLSAKDPEKEALIAALEALVDRDKRWNRRHNHDDCQEIEDAEALLV